MFSFPFIAPGLCTDTGVFWVQTENRQLMSLLSFYPSGQMAMVLLFHNHIYMKESFWRPGHVMHFISLFRSWLVFGCVNGLCNVYILQNALRGRSHFHPYVVHGESCCLREIRISHRDILKSTATWVPSKCTCTQNSGDRIVLWSFLCKASNHSLLLGHEWKTNKLLSPKIFSWWTKPLI